MDRLTERTHGSIADELVEEMGNPIDCVFVKNEHDTCAGICGRNEFCDDCPLNKVIRKLAEYEDAEEQGLLLRLPCVIGSDVWKIVNQRDTFTDIPYKIVSRRSFRLDMLGYIGKTVFLTREEAEQALESMKAGEENEID